MLAHPKKEEDDLSSRFYIVTSQLIYSYAISIDRLRANCEDLQSDPTDVLRRARIQHPYHPSSILC